MTDQPQNSVVWAEIPVTDLGRAKNFYASVTGYTLKEDKMGSNPIVMFPYADDGVSGHLTIGKPAPKGVGNTIHLKVRGPIETAMERVTAAGGEVVSPVVEVPSGRFAYCFDPDGNSIGIYTD